MARSPPPVPQSMPQAAPHTPLPTVPQILSIPTGISEKEEVSSVLNTLNNKTFLSAYFLYEDLSYLFLLFLPTE